MNYTFISGATGGIGKAFSLECAKLGYNLFLTGRSEQKLLSLKESIKAEFNVEVLTFACDLTSQTQRDDMIKFAISNRCVFDRILNVAGVDTQKAFSDYTIEKVLFQIRVNAEATIALTHQLLALKDENLEILTLSSMSGASPMPYFALYSATKAMLTSFFTSLHYELKKEGVKVTTVLPGGVYTRPDIVEDIKNQGLWGKLSAKTPEFVAKKSLRKVAKNQLIYIPGGFNKLLYFIMKIIPKRIVLKFIANRWKKQTKDAF